MLTSLHILIKKRDFLWIGVVLILVAFSSRLAAYVVLNQASLAHLQGEDAVTTYQRALAFAPNDLHIRWQLARAALDTNNKDVAAEAIEPLTRYANRDPLLFADVLYTLTAIGQSDRVIHLYETNRNLNQSTMVNDIVALAYIDQGKFEDALALRPADLYLNYRLWQQSKATHNPANVDTIREKLVYFPLSAIDPANERLLKYTGEAILSLLESKIWTREEAIYVIAYLVWKHERSPEVEQIVQRFRNRYPNEPILPVLATELTQRRAKTPPQDSLLSGNKDEKEGGNLVKSTRLNTFDYLAVTKNAVFWQWDAWHGKNNDGALFFSGLDPFESNSALRIMSLWQRPSGENEVPPYAEYSSEEIMLEPSTEYMLTLRYKNDSLGKAIPFVALLDYTNNTPRFTFSLSELPNTADVWQTWQKSGKSYTEPIKVRLLLRILGTGSVWFDNVQLIKKSTTN